MEKSRPQKWRRHERRRTKDVRRLLAAGAVVGVAAGLVAQAFVSSSIHGEIEGLVRMALLLPGLVFIGWWLLSPVGTTELLVDAPTDSAPAVADRAERVEHVFDSAAVPRARRSRLHPSDDHAAREIYQSTLRRHPQSDVSTASFGVRRPEPSPNVADVG
jgi:hypothetical protein